MTITRSRLCLATSLAVVFMALPNSGSQAAEPPMQCTDHVVTPIGTGQIVTDDEVATAVPPAGFATAVSALFRARMETLVVERERTGRISVRRCSSDARPGSPSLFDGHRRVGPSSPPACEDDASNLAGWVQEGVFHWRYNGSSHPAEVSAAAAEADLVAATRNVVGANNDCGLVDNVAARQQFDGRTRRGADIAGTDTFNPFCKRSGDGVSVVDFGRVGSGGAIFICAYLAPDAGPDTVVEADVRLNRDEYEWTVAPADPGCDGRLGIENYATPARGSNFGLDPVPEFAHANLSMSISPGGPCQNEASSLGLGDVLGLRALY